MSAPPLHEKLQAMAWMIGEWSGEGAGKYPTIKPFNYLETITFSHAGKPVIAYSQKTRKLMEDGTPGPPMHAESGFLRPGPDGDWEWLLAQASGIVEVQKGPYDPEGRSLSLASALVGNATKVSEVQRELRHDQAADAIVYCVSMSTKNQPMQEHLTATLKRAGA